MVDGENTTATLISLYGPANQTDDKLALLSVDLTYFPYI